MPKITPTPAVDAEFAALCPALTDEELRLLVDSILAEGCREAILCWDHAGTPILDGHNRYEICRGEGLPFAVKLLELPDRAAAAKWILLNQLGRRNSSEEQKSYFRGKLYLQEKQVVGRPEVTNQCSHSDYIRTVERIAEETNVSPKTVQRDAKFAEAVDDLAKKSPELAAAAREGTIAKAAVKALADKAKAELKKLEKLKGTELRKAATKAAKPPEEPKPVKGADQKHTEAFDARQQIKVWADTIGRWLRQSPSIDEYRAKWPSKQGDHVVEMATQFYEALKNWQKGIK